MILKNSVVNAIANSIERKEKERERNVYSLCWSKQM